VEEGGVMAMMGWAPAGDVVGAVRRLRAAGARRRRRFSLLALRFLGPVVVVLVLGAVGVPALAQIEIDGAFGDWRYEDLRALDEYWGMTLGVAPSYGVCSAIDLDGLVEPPGDDATYLFHDGHDDARDLVALYVRQGEEYLYFRVDLWDLDADALPGSLDLYVLLDWDPDAGEEWLPDFTDCRTDRPWELAICIYDEENRALKRGVPGQPQLPGDLLGPRFSADYDAVEFGVPLSLLRENGWTPGTPYQMQVFTTRDGTDGGAGEVPDASDLTDAFVDDDRGFGDGILEGGIASDAPPPGRARYVIEVDASAPLLDERRIRALVDRSADPEFPVRGVGMYRALETVRALGIPLEVHLSGTMAMGIQWAAPEFNEALRAAMDEGVVDLMGTVFGNHPLPFFHGAVNLAAMAEGMATLAAIYGIDPGSVPVFWTPMRTARGDLAEEILEANRRHGFSFQATVLDANTHHHDWFEYDNVWDGIPGNEVRVDLDDDVRKLHEYRGVKLAFIDRYTQLWQAEPMGPGYDFYGKRYEPSLQIGIRARLLALALDPDPAQVLLSVREWDDLGGQPRGRMPSASNPDGFAIAMDWVAVHPWIEVTTLTRILRGEVDLDGDGEGDEWDTVTDEPLVDHLPDFYGLPLPPYWLSGELPLNSYAWLRDAGQGSYGADNPYPDPANVDNIPWNDGWDDGYQNWIAGSRWEWGLLEMVPALTGWQYDRALEGGYPADPLPSGKVMGAIWSWSAGEETPAEEGIIPETWANLEGAGVSNGLLETARLAFLAMISETGWHEERTVRAETGAPDDEDARGIISERALALNGHIRDVNVLVAAAQWAESAPPAETVVDQVDLDLDGELEYVLRNDRVFLVFENDGGRLVKAFSLDMETGEPVEVVGCSIAAPDRGGEDEALDAFVSDEPSAEMNRVSCFREEGYANAEYAVSVVGSVLVFYSPDLKIKRRVTLPPGADYVDVEYSVDRPPAPLNVEFALAPNPVAAARLGKSALEQLGGPYDGLFVLRNREGGEAYVRLFDAEYRHHDDLASRHTLALAQRIVVQVGESGYFRLGFGPSWRDVPPVVTGVRMEGSPMSSDEGGELRIEALVEGYDIESVRLLYGGTPLAPLVPPLYLLDLVDDGTQGDRVAGDGVYSFAAAIAPGQAPREQYVLVVEAGDEAGNVSEAWPYLTVSTPAGSQAWSSAGGLAMAGASAEGAAFGGVPAPWWWAAAAPGAGGGPVIPFGGYLRTHVSPELGGTLRLIVQIQDPDGPQDVYDAELVYAGVRTGVYLSNIGNAFWALELELPPGIPEGQYVLGVEARDYDGQRSNLWPTWDVR
jgi:hypothetical protein